MSIFQTKKKIRGGSPLTFRGKKVYYNMKTNLPHMPTKFHQNPFSRFRGVRPYLSNWGKYFIRGSFPLTIITEFFDDLTFIPINLTCLQNFNKIGLIVSEIYFFKNLTVLNTFVRGSLPLTRMGMIFFAYILYSA